MRRQSVRLGTVAGIPVDVHWTVAAIAAIVAEVLGASVLPATLPHRPATVYWAVAAIVSVVFLGSLLVHELAHALVAARNGVGMHSITLWMLGGMTELDGEPPSAGAELRIALAGPAASLTEAAVFGAVAVGLGHSGGATVAAAAAAWLAVANGVIAVFNLLPGAPLDGGRVLRAALWRRYRDEERATMAAAEAGRYLGFLLTAAGVAVLLLWASLDGIWLAIVGWFLASAAATEERVALATSAVSGLRVADVMMPDPGIAAGWSTVQDFLDLVATRSRQSAFPVTGADGCLAGLAITSQLARIRPASRPVLRLDQVALAVPSRYLATPDDRAAPLLTRPLLGDEVAAVVCAHDRIVGLVTGAALRTAVEQALRGGMPRRRLSAAPATGDRDGPGSGGDDGLSTEDHAVLVVPGRTWARRWRLPEDSDLAIRAFGPGQPGPKGLG